MSNQDNHTELFDRYLRNELSAEERMAFDENLLNDDAFNAAFIEHKTIAMGIHDYGKIALKDYLKTNAVVHVTNKNFSINRILYAMAAMLLIVFGVYAVFNYHTPVAKEPTEMATTELKKKEPIQQDTESLAENNSTIKSIEVPDKAKNEAVPPATEISPANAGATIENSDPSPHIVAGETDDAKDKEMEDYTILSDKKLSDTILFAFNAIEPISPNKASGADKESISKKSLPSNNYGGYNNKAERNTAIDTNKLSKQKSIVEKTEKYVIEFWQSPVNFKGYKMIGKTVQLFGLGNKNVRLFNYNGKLYLSNGSNIFILTPCIDGCSYKTEPDQQIITLILEQ